MPRLPSTEQLPRTLGSFLRFALVGAISAAASLLLFHLLSNWAGIHYLLAFLATFLVVNAVAHSGTRYYAFSESHVPMRQGLLRQYCVGGGLLMLNMVLMNTMVAGLGWVPLVAAALLSVLGLPVNYLLHRKFTFGLNGKPTR